MKREIGELLTFELMSATATPDPVDNGGYAIAFVPLEGFQWCRYYNGSKTWMSNVTKKTVAPTEWLRLVKPETKP